MPTEYTWDEVKRRTNLRDHGLDFAEAPVLWQSPMETWLDTREDYGEDRWTARGLLHGRIVVVSYTAEVTPTRTQVRIITLRKANRHEQRQYAHYLQRLYGIP